MQDLEEQEILAVFRALRSGCDPDTGRALPELDIYRSETVQVALNQAISLLNSNRKTEHLRPPNYFKRWTEEDQITLRKEYKRGTSIIQIARQLGRSYSGVRFKLISIGLLENPQGSDENTESFGTVRNSQTNNNSELKKCNLTSDITEEQLEKILENCKRNNETLILRDMKEFSPQIQLVLAMSSNSMHQQAEEINKYFSIAKQFSDVLLDIHSKYIVNQTDCDELIAELGGLGALLDYDSILLQRIQKEIRSLIESRVDLPTDVQYQRERQLIDARRKLDRNAPMCIRQGCASQMTIREKDGDFFWGCRTFPSCFGSRYLTKAERDIIPD